MAEPKARTITAEALYEGIGPNEVISCRELLPEVLNANGYLGEGAEIGVQRGFFSAHLLSAWKGRKLWSIDPWRHFAEVYDDIANRSQAEQDAIFADASARLAPFGDRSETIRRTSAEAAPLFADGQLDFAYIDAQHHYEAVVEDLALWSPKVRRGGILAGHDYLNAELEIGLFGVKRAVDEFAQARGLKILTTGRFDQEGEYTFPSWFLVMP